MPAGKVQAKVKEKCVLLLKQLSLCINNVIYKHSEKLTTYTKAKQKNCKRLVKGEGENVLSMPLSTFLCIKACVVAVYDPRSLFVILWEHSPR